VRSPEANINTSCHSFEAVLSGLTVSDRYDHLRLILSKNYHPELGQKYLMVSRTSFGLVRLIDVDFSGNKIQMDLEDIRAGLIKRIYLNIDDHTFHFLLISLKDIQQIVKTEIVHKTGSEDLLEFDF
jgi:hypothetical protein